jgi:hypothetical protein
MDQYRDGEWVVIARIQTKTCPVQIMEHYMKLANVANWLPRSPPFSRYRALKERSQATSTRWSQLY